jgi:adenine-specific DNA-methyltransferase
MTIKQEILHSNIETVNSKEKMLEVVNANEVELSKESYTLNWLGKSYARLLANLPPKTLINEDVTHNQLEQNKDSKNLLIKGDNLEVLKHMVNAYSEKVKMIYIDPPYNTGGDGFTYNDDRNFTVDQLVELAGIDVDEAKRILEFTDKGSSSHSAWLTFMYPRLYIAKELLKEDGIIFISIDDNEVNQLTLICDEIFGEFNALGPIIHNKLNSKSDTLNIQKNHEYLICYRKSSIDEVSIVKNEVIEKEVFKEENRFYILNDPITTRGEGGTLNKRKNLGYTVYYNSSTKDFIGVSDYDLELALTSNNEEEIYTDNQDLLSKGYLKIRPPSVRGKLGVWTWDINKFNSEKDNIIIKTTKNGFSVRKRTFVNSAEVISTNGKYFININQAGNTKSILEYSTNDGTTQLTEIMGKADIFSNPKNINLLKYAFSLVQGNDYIAMDFFAGSGSSLHALQEINKDDNGSRKFIGVQREEKCNTDSSAFEAGYETIFDITKARITKASEKIREENPDFQGDLGFKIFETVEDFRVEDDEKELSLMTLTMFDDVVLTDEQYHTLLTTWRLYDGSELTTPVQDIVLDNYTAHLCDNRLYMIASDFSSTALKAILKKLDTDKEFSPNKIVFFGKNFDSVKQMELNEALKSYANKKSLEIDLVGRN